MPDIYFSENLDGYIYEIQFVVDYCAVCCLIGLVYYRYPGWILTAGEVALRWKAGMRRYEVRVDDHNWVYLAGGEGENLLLIHGYGSEKDHFGPFLSGFNRSYHVIVPDLPGFGENTKILSVNYDIPSQVERLHRFVQQLGLDSFHLAGISMGGYICAYYASEHPEKVKSLVLMDAAGVESPKPSEVWELYRKSGKIVMLYRTPREFDELIKVLFYKPPRIPRHFKTYLADEANAVFDFRLKIINDIRAGGLYLLEHRLARIQAPVLIIWGVDDRILDVSGVEQFQRKIRDHRVVLLDRCGHVPYLEKPDETRTAIREFLKSLH